MFGGTLTGGESISIWNGAQWATGTLSLNSINVPEDAAFLITSSSGRNLAGSHLNIGGLLKWVGGVNFPAYNGARINILSGGKFEIENNQRIYDPGAGGQPKVINYGLIHKTMGIRMVVPERISVSRSRTTGPSRWRRGTWA